MWGYLLKGFRFIVILGLLALAGQVFTSPNASVVPLSSCPGDFDGNGRVNIADFLAFAGAFGSRSGEAKYNAVMDMDGSGAIDISDFLAFAEVFGTTCEQTVISIPDANLRAAIEKALDKAKGAPITRTEMASLTSLDAPGKNIRDLAGLEAATNLTHLNLQANNITDISGLSGLTNLTHLNLQNNDITDIPPLPGLTNLRILYLNGNSITDISALSNLTNLTDLYLGSNSISDISALSNLTNLTDLYLFGNSISDISALSNLTNLTDLYLGSNSTSDISALSNLTNLTDLSLFGNSISDISALSNLTNLTILYLSNNNISDISALSNLTNLTWLDLWANSTSDISALSNLTNLTMLNLSNNTLSEDLSNNNISDISALSNLTNLTMLNLYNNTVADISGLSSLIRLREINLAFNNITDVSPLSGLINLRVLRLDHNNIPDVSAMSGLTNLRQLNLVGNILNDASITEYIPALEKSGVEVLYHVLVKGDFDVEFVFLDAFTEKHKRILRYVARRWMAIIREDLPDHQFAQAWSGQCGERSFEIPSGERIDDIRIYITTFEADHGPVGWGSPGVLRGETHLPIIGCMGFDLARVNLYIAGLHEIAHVLGFGTIWDNLDLLQEPSADAHFNGPLAIAAFDDAGGRDYAGAKVPVHRDRWHWRYSVFPGELMRTIAGDALSAITVQSLADLGYGVDVTQVDAYTLPGANAGKPVAKIVVPTPDVSASHMYESSVRFWGGGMNLDLTDARQSWQAAPLADVEPKLTCGAGLMQQPIYVVDPQGRVVRTIGH